MEGRPAVIAGWHEVGVGRPEGRGPGPYQVSNGCIAGGKKKFPRVVFLYPFQPGSHRIQSFLPGYLHPSRVNADPLLGVASSQRRSDAVRVVETHEAGIPLGTQFPPTAWTI